MCFPTYRQQGLLIARDYPLVEMMCQIYSNKGDKLKGRQLPIMYSDREKGFFSISGNLATQYPQAVGWAMALGDQGRQPDRGGLDRRRRDRRGRFPQCGHLRRSLSGAGDPQRRQQPVGDLDLLRNRRRRAHHLRGARRRLRHCRPRVDGNDALAVYAATRWAADRARSNLGPTLIELFTYRVEGHSHLRRSDRLPAQGCRREMAARRSDRAAEGASDRARRMGRGAPQGAGGAARRRGPRRAEGGREAGHARQRPL